MTETRRAHKESNSDESAKEVNQWEDNPPFQIIFSLNLQHTPNSPTQLVSDCAKFTVRECTMSRSIPST